MFSLLFLLDMKGSWLKTNLWFHFFFFFHLLQKRGMDMTQLGRPNILAVDKHMLGGKWPIHSYLFILHCFKIVTWDLEASSLLNRMELISISVIPVVSCLEIVVKSGNLSHYVSSLFDLFKDEIIFLKTCFSLSWHKFPLRTGEPRSATLVEMRWAGREDKILPSQFGPLVEPHFEEHFQQLSASIQMLVI